MENLPDVLISDILERVDKTSDRNAFSMVSTRFCNIEAHGRKYLKVGSTEPHDPINKEALTSLFIRFPNLTKIEIIYSGWLVDMEKQLDNEHLLILSSHCSKLTDITLSLCFVINDVGMSNLALCKTLKALKLKFIPGISSNGLLSIASGCKNIRAVHLNECTRVNSVGWLEYFGRHGNLETLSIKNCKGVGQDDLIKLGYGLNTTLKRLHFEIDVNDTQPFGAITEGFWCDSLLELSLVNCGLNLGRPLRYILTRCPALESLSLNMCDSLHNLTLTSLSQTSQNLRKISLHLPTNSSTTFEEYNHTYGLTDYGLVSLAQRCYMLEEFELSYSGEHPIHLASDFTQNSLLFLVRMCPLRVLVLKNIICLNDDGMEEISSSSSPSLQVLHIQNCPNITDDGIIHVINLCSLNVLKISNCFGISNSGIQAISRSGKVDLS